MPDAQKYTSKLSHARVLILGGTSGIGFCVAEACLESLCHITIASSSASRISAALARLTSSYPSAATAGHISGLACDLSDPAALEQNLAALFAQVGVVDHIVYTAGDKLATVPLAEMTLAAVQQAGMVRFFAPLLLAKHARAHLAPGPAASLTLTTGSVAEKPMPGWAVVAGYAGALHGVVRNLALDMAPVRVNAVSPGAVETEMWAGMGEEAVGGLREEMGRRLLTGRMGRPQDVAEAYLYVMRDENVTGTVVRTDGGGLIV